MTLFAGGGGVFIEKGGHPNGVVVWKQTGDRQFAFTIVEISYDYNSNGNGGNSSSNENGTIKIKGVATLNAAGDSLSLTVTYQGLDLDENVTDFGSATLTAARIQVESL